MTQLDKELAQRISSFLPRLRRFAYALTGNLDDGDDLVQDTCLRALSRIDQWEPGTQLESWMFRIARNAWIDKVRQEQNRGEHAAVEALDLVGSDGRHTTEIHSELRAVSRAIRTLPSDQQLLVALVCVDGQSYKAASDILGIPVGTVMSRLARARKSLNTVVGDASLLSSAIGAKHDKH